MVAHESAGPQFVNMCPTFFYNAVKVESGLLTKLKMHPLHTEWLRMIERA